MNEDDPNAETYTVKLNTQPSDTVEVEIGKQNDDGNRLTVYPGNFSFDDGNWEDAQTVEVTARDDDDPNDETITLTHTLTGGSEYDGFNAGNVTVRIDDDDTAGVKITPTNLDVNEDDSSTYDIVLNTLPTRDVTIMISESGDTGDDITLSITTLTFSTSTWDMVQQVTVTAKDDDDAIDETVELRHSVSGYGSIRKADSVTVTVNDPDEAGVDVTPTNLRADEGSEEWESYDVTLDFRPSGNVKIDISQDGDGDLEVTPSRLTFTPSDWYDPQQVMVKPKDDDDAENATSTISHTVSGAEEYDGIEVEDVDVEIIDDDKIGMTIAPTEIILNEDVSTPMQYTVKLNTRPSDSVTVTLTKNGDTDDDVTVSHETLTFTTSDWRNEQRVSVSTGQDADMVSEVVTIGHLATSGDSDYNVTGADVTVTVNDDDEPGVTIRPTVLNLDEDGPSDDYMVRLNAQPDADVTVGIQNTDDTVTVSPSALSLTFNSTNWNREQRVTVTPVQDNDINNESFTIAHTVSGDPNYAALDTANLTVEVNVTDDEAPGVIIAPTSLRLTEGGSDGEYTVRLKTPPTADETVAIAENNDAISLSDTTLTFTTQTWNSAQTVLVTPEEDPDRNNETVTITHSVSGTGDYSSVTAGSVRVTVSDNDRTDPTDGDSGESATVSFNRSAYSVAEGGSITLGIILSEDPGRTITFFIGRENRGGATESDYSLQQNSVTFNSGETRKNIIFNAAQDTEDDDGESVRLSFTFLPTNFAAGSPGEATVYINDDDVGPGVNISSATLSVYEGGSGDYTVRLNTNPGGVVTVTVNDPTDNTDVTAEPASLTFNASNWQTEQTVTVSAIQDDDDVNDSATITHSVSGYGSVTTAADVSVTVTDDNVPSVEVGFQNANYEVVEGNEALVRVILSEDPRRTVTIPINATNLAGASDDDYSGVPSEVTFDVGETTMSFAFAATQDNMNDDDEGVRLSFGALPDYVTEGSNGAAVVSITDDDGAGVMVNPKSLTIDEGSSDRYSVFLDTRPTANVTIEITSPGGDVSLDKSSLTFTRDNWDAAQAVTVSAGHDADEDDDTAVIFHSARGAAEYTGIGIDGVTVTVADDDSEETLVSITRVVNSIAEGRSATFRLTRVGPTSRNLSVRINVSQNGAYVESTDLGVSPWTIPSGANSSSVSVATIDDNVDEPNGTVTATLNAGAGYKVGSPRSATIQVVDNDVPGQQTSTTTPKDLSPTPTRTPKPTATPVPIEKVEVTPVPGATTIQPDETKQLKSAGAALKIPYISRARTYQVIFAETDTCQETALGNVKAWVYTAEGEREHEVWSIHPLEISFTLTKNQVEDFGGLGVLFQTYAIGGIVVQGSDRLPGRWNDIRPTFFDANPDGGVTAYAMTRYFSPTFCLYADPALLERAYQQVNGIPAIAVPTPTVSPTPTATATAMPQDAGLPASGDGSSSTTLIFALIAAAIFMSLLLTTSITDRARPGKQ